MKKICISLFLSFVFIFGSVLSAQSALPDTGSSDTSLQALNWMVEEVADMLIRKLGGDAPAADIYVQGVTMQNVPLVLGEYLAASLPIKMSRRSGHSISIHDRPGLGYYSILGKAFRIGEKLNLFISLQDEEGKVLFGKELHLPLSSGVEELLVTANHGGNSADLYEPDSSTRPMALNFEDSSVERALDSRGDKDWFSFSLPENANPSMLTIRTTGNLDTYIEVYKNGDYSDPVIENDDFDNQNAQVLVDVAPGETVVAAVRGYDESETGSYSLVSSVREIAPDMSEPNNRMEDALLLDIDSEPNTFQIFPSGDHDWYKIEIPGSRSGGFLNIETGGNLDTYMELYNDEGDLLIQDDDGSGDVQARIGYGPVQGGETLFVNVRHYDDGGTGEYTLFMNFFDPEYDEFEPDDSWEAASELNLSGTGDVLMRDYLFSTSVDSDWVVFTLQQSQKLILRTEGDADTYLVLYDENHQVLQESDDDGDDYNGRIEYTFSPGTYRLETQQYQEDARAGAEYRLVITAE